MSEYQNALNYLYEKLPVFQRIGAVAYKKDLTNTLALCEALGNPQHKFKSLHVTGTNGKGSSSHMLAAILQAAGYKTGLYTSPHLKEFTERIRINGIEVSKDFVVDFVNRIKPEIERIQPSFFEVTVAMAFDFFARQHVDIAVIEVGLGGRLDSTNVITPVISLITNISYDHQDILGDTLPEIAFEKAGIIKSNVPVVVSERQKEVEHVFINKAKETNSKLTFASDLLKVSMLREGEFFVQHGDTASTFKLALKGYYQQKNLAGVLAVTRILQSKGYTISENDIKTALEQTTQLTGLKGRWQKLNDHPLMICDTGHNEAGITEVLHQIGEQQFNKLHLVIGFVRDKDIGKVLSLLPHNALYYFCQAKIPRAMPAAELKERAEQEGLTGVAIADVNEAIEAARMNCQEDDMIFIGGSTFVVAEIENL